MDSFDFLVVGAGISGAAAAYELAALGRVAIIEAEAQPGYHSTGRSAALYTPNYGGPLARKINAAGRAFFTDPPEGFADAPLLRPRGALTLGRPGEDAALDAVVAHGTARDPILRIDAAEAGARAPLMRPEHIAGGAFEPGVTDMDVAAIHQGFLKGAARRGARLVCSAAVTALTRHGDRGWTVTTAAGTFGCGIVVNAAGAWGDELGRLAGAPRLGLVPKRRTAILIDAPPGMAVADLPLIEFAGHGPYLKPESGRLMASLGDETPLPPQDVQPDEMDIALLVDWLERHSTVAVRRAPTAWAGLRCFVADESPVAGFDPDLGNFFWLVGQGGFGIMMSPTLARAARGLIGDGRLPADIAGLGVAAEDLSPARLFALQM